MNTQVKVARSDKPVIGITLGDINGIGPEVIIKTLRDTRLLEMMTPVIYGSTKVLSYYRKMYEIDDLQYTQIKGFDFLNHKKINVINCWQDTFEIKTGSATPEGGKSALLALEKAVDDLIQDQIDALVTAPINKHNIQNENFKYVGHTEYISEKLGAKESLMMMVAKNLRVGVATGHVPLKDISAKLSPELLKAKIDIFLESLKKDFGILKPKLAVLALNPHAGESGLLGDEEEKVIVPTLEEFKKKGHLVFGPFPADGFFGTMQQNKFDGVLAMYHDQGLIPFKTIAFEEGVNYTAGLSKIRTSPDHGTAYNIAGKNLADPQSIREAIYLACDIARQRISRLTYAES
ncbi:MAG: 4-hydroxythreonine-4-phosphate dehydrogenase PdxA [Cyclobacteriaceae bacterium]|nr:4-hydroxythreonine-4-phosphate dehydrogenase PdxA [Cyclobacteriaceae bacterium]